MEKRQQSATSKAEIATAISAGESWNISTNPTLPTEKMAKDR